MPGRNWHKDKSSDLPTAGLQKENIWEHTFELLCEEDGQAIAEFGLVAFLLVVILVSILEMGLLLNAKLVLSASAREIARICAVEGGTTSRAEEVLTRILESTGLSSSEIQVTITPRQAIYGTIIYVSLSYDYRIKSPLVSALTGPTVTLTSKAVTRSEFVPR